MKAKLVLLATLAMPAIASAQFMDGNELVKAMNANERVERRTQDLGADAIDSGVYMGFVLSAYDGLALSGRLCHGPTISGGNLWPSSQSS